MRMQTLKSPPEKDKVEADELLCAAFHIKPSLVALENNINKHYREVYKLKPCKVTLQDIIYKIIKAGLSMEDSIPVHLIQEKVLAPGVILWVQVGSYPFWPAMISYDPQEGCFTKFREGIKKSVRMYHVQYFGPRVQRGWTSVNSVVLFEGEDKFNVHKLAKLALVTASKMTKKKYDNDYNPKKNLLNSWMVSVSEAEQAFLVKDLTTRYVQFVFKYESRSSSKSGAALNNDASQKNGTLKRRKKRKNNSHRPSKIARVASDINEDICVICEKGSTDLICSGKCKLSFHKDCIGIFNECVSFKCVNCELGVECCFVCKKVDASVISCVQCNYFYHEACLSKYECCNLKKFICSRHACLTCFKDKKHRTLSKTQCFRCPTSFHASPKCVPVGCVKLTPSIIICPDHILGRNKKSPQPTVNISYCVICGEGGELVCCETCPNSVHASCINKEIPEGDFFCEPCTKRQYLYIGMIVWAKTGAYRWWPAKLVDPSLVPENIKNLEYYDGEFLVQYFGTDEYFWTHRGRVIRYADYHREKDGNKKDSKIISWFNLSLEEAAVAYESYIDMISNKISDRKPSYAHIATNRALPPAWITPFRSAFVCDCDPKKPNPCGPNSLCLNRSMSVECQPDHCRAKEKCENMRILKRQYPKVKLMKTKDRGWGLEASEYIPKGTFVIEYVGEIITTDEFRKRFEQMVKDNSENYYFCYLDSQRMIDAGPKGNLARFINHSCNPNCEMQKWSVNGDLRVGIFAISDIKPGEEFTFNYLSDSNLFSHKCLCGSSNCRGFIGKGVVKTNGKKYVKKA